MDGIATLNRLIAATIDAADGYARAAEGVEGAELKAALRALAGERAQLVARLRSEVVRLGGVPEEQATALAAGARRFADLKLTVLGLSRREVLRELDERESDLRGLYTRALNDALPEDGRRAIERALRDLSEGVEALGGVEESPA